MAELLNVNAGTFHLFVSEVSTYRKQTPTSLA
jgi:hypothetical protein